MMRFLPNTTNIIKTPIYIENDMIQSYIHDNFNVKTIKRVQLQLSDCNNNKIDKRLELNVKSIIYKSIITALNAGYTVKINGGYLHPSF